MRVGVTAQLVVPALPTTPNPQQAWGRHVVLIGRGAQRRCPARPRARGRYPSRPGLAPGHSVTDPGAQGADPLAGDLDAQAAARDWICWRLPEPMRTELAWCVFAHH